MSLRCSRFLFAIAAAALLLGSASESLAVPITQPTGLNPGDQYRLVFVTSTTISGSSSSIATYNNFVTTAANTETALVALGTTWTAIASVSGVAAYNNTGTNPGASTGVPIYLVDGTTLIASNNADLWDSLLNAALNVDQSGATRNTTVWTGTFADGTQDNTRFLGANFPRMGDSSSTSGAWIMAGNSGKTAQYSIYAMSGTLTAVPEPGTALLLAMGFAGLGVVRRVKQS